MLPAVGDAEHISTAIGGFFEAVFVAATPGDKMVVSDIRGDGSDWRWTHEWMPQDSLRPKRVE